MLNEKQKDGLGSAHDGFYESKREWLGKRHFILAFERYHLWFLLRVPVLLFRFNFIEYQLEVDSKFLASLSAELRSLS